MSPTEEPKMISFQLSPEFYHKFVAFCFRTEISRSDAIRKGLEILMGLEMFIHNKGKTQGERVQS